jgi:1-acyl-sn-glycerol-3-phosphate acyltransferase
MLSFISRIWRIFGTGLSFLLFGVGGILLWLLGIPLLHLLFPRRERRQKAARRLVHGSFWLFVRFMRLMGVLRFEMVDAQRLKRADVADVGQIIVANHPTLLDVVFLLSLVPDAACIVRAGLSNNPFTRAAVSLAGYVCNDWGVEVVEVCVQTLRSGSSLVIFPEGTRTHPQRTQRWHRGAANVALRADVPLTPVRINCEPPSLRKGEPWWRVPPRPMHYTIRVLDDLPLAGAARDLTERLKQLLN